MIVYFSPWIWFFWQSSVLDIETTKKKIHIQKNVNQNSFIHVESHMNAMIKQVLACFWKKNLQKNQWIKLLSSACIHEHAKSKAKRTKKNLNEKKFETRKIAMVVCFIVHQRLMVKKT